MFLFYLQRAGAGFPKPDWAACSRAERVRGSRSGEGSLTVRASVLRALRGEEPVLHYSGKPVWAGFGDIGL